MTLEPGGLLLFSELMLILAAMLYGLPTGESNHQHRLKLNIRRHVAQSLVPGVAVCVLAGWHGTLLLALAMTALSISTSGARHFVPLRFRAELEVAAAALIPATTWLMIGYKGLVTGWPLTILPYATGRRSAYLVAAALLVFSVRGGTWIVQGILARGGTMPPATTADPESASHFHVPSKDLNHGRMIGDVERLILAMLVANGQFAAIAFFFAGKGLIRSKELEARAWADYLLLGSLSSFLVALVVGLLLQQVMLWK